MELINNNWTIGIGGGLLSGLIIAMGSRLLLSRRLEKERKQTIFLANTELLKSLTPTVAEAAIPEAEIIVSLISATARKYDLPVDALFSMNELVDCMIKDIMDSQFIPLTVKKDYCEKLSALRESPQIGHMKESRQENYEYRRRLTAWTTSLVGLMSSLVTFFILISGEHSTLKLLLIAFITMLALSMSAAPSMMFDRDRPRPHKELPNKSMDSDEE